MVLYYLGLVGEILYCTVHFRAHKVTRSVVERGIGQWKRRFQVLHSEVCVTPPSKVCKVVFVCAMLHNICKERNIDIILEDAYAEDVEIAAAAADGDDHAGPPLAGNPPHVGLHYRDEFARRHFK